MGKLITIKDSEEVSLHFTEGETITLISESEEVHLDYQLENGDYQILFFHRNDTPLKLYETGKIVNAHAVIKYLEVGRNSLVQDNRIDVYRDSSLEIQSVYLGYGDKKISYLLTNKEAYSETKISNNVVALDDSDFFMEVTGKIESQARYAKAHQKSRCLTIGHPKKAGVKPVLLIDNNEVEASHSLSSGTIDEDVLFYMNSRGLSEKDALSLLLRSYLIPNESFYEGFPMAEDIAKEAREKVDDVCSM
ncbi:MAG: SufD family Fe-S cluster assembly protein [Erysipelotrichaceae bacterium]|nr:SufD family Fe-S cluster assembly protein [Erysipelotrichaceae bacterium]